LDLAFDLVVGNAPFALQQPFTDLSGNAIVLEEFKCYLSGIRFADDDGTRVADFADNVLLLDGARPRFRERLGIMANAHIHAMEFVGGLADDVQWQPEPPSGHPLADPAMACNGQSGHLALLMRGFVDKNTNGLFDPDVDVAFDYRPSGPDAWRWRHLHIHADMVSGEPLDIALRLDMRFILLGIDLEQHPYASGTGPMAMTAMANLVAALVPAY
jgi:hypothetical protein